MNTTISAVLYTSKTLSITKEHIKRLIEFDVSELSEYEYYTPFLQLSKDLFLFSYGE